MKLACSCGAVMLALYAIFCVSAWVSENSADWKETWKRRGTK